MYPLTILRLQIIITLLVVRRSPDDAYEKSICRHSMLQMRMSEYRVQPDTPLDLWLPLSSIDKGGAPTGELHLTVTYTHDVDASLLFGGTCGVPGSALMCGFY